MGYNWIWHNLDTLLYVQFRLHKFCETRCDYFLLSWQWKHTPVIVLICSLSLDVDTRIWVPTVMSFSEYGSSQKTDPDEIINQETIGCKHPRDWQETRTFLNCVYIQNWNTALQVKQDHLLCGCEWRRTFTWLKARRIGVFSLLRQTLHSQSQNGRVANDFMHGRLGCIHFLGLSTAELQWTTEGPVKAAFL